jgi:DNA polymerase II large subunit
MNGTPVSEADKRQIANLAVNHNLNGYQIAAITGKPKSTVYEQLQELQKSDQLDFFASNKDKIFEELQLKMVNLADADTLKSMLGKRGFTDLGILQDKIQLLRGQATEIIDYKSINLHSTLSEFKAAMRALRPPADDEAIPLEDSPDA